MNPPISPQYVTSLEEIMWGGFLVAVTLALHGCGMLAVLRTSGAVRERSAGTPSLSFGLTVLVLSGWMILLVHLIEVMVWAGFFYWKGAVNAASDGTAGATANTSLCYYFALLDYTCLGSNYNLHLRWRLLEGMISMAGLLTFAWSTGVLMTLAQEFQDQQLSLIKQKREKRRARPAPAAHPAAGQNP